mmetsp:Transcript_2200/g.7980  ORF Transcript_2200/g.7980 Transcript_2200/m.7980 type:complete len:180 (-) Transcript_2200:568-1107(-)
MRRRVFFFSRLLERGDWRVDYNKRGRRSSSSRGAGDGEGLRSCSREQSGNVTWRRESGAERFGESHNDTSSDDDEIAGRGTVANHYRPRCSARLRRRETTIAGVQDAAPRETFESPKEENLKQSKLRVGRENDRSEGYYTYRRRGRIAGGRAAKTNEEKRRCCGLQKWLRCVSSGSSVD